MVETISVQLAPLRDRLAVTPREPELVNGCISTSHRAAMYAIPLRSAMMGRMDLLDQYRSQMTTRELEKSVL